MLTLNAFFHRKEEQLEPRPCIVEKVIPLTGEEFDRFAAQMVTREWDFIRENKDLMYCGTDGRMHCLLVTGDGRKDGILVESEGAGYARYAAHVPHVRAILEANRYPSLAEYTKRLCEMVDHIADAAANIKPGETRAAVSFEELEKLSGIDVEIESSVLSALNDMMFDHPKILCVELNEKGYFITPMPAISGPGQTAELEPQQEQQLTP